MSGIKESDWKLFRKLHPTILNRFCERILKEAEDIMAKKGMTSYECYLSLYKHIAEHDKQMVRIFDDQRRSTALTQLMLMYSNSLMTQEELDQFSPDSQKWIIS